MSALLLVPILLAFIALTVAGLLRGDCLTALAVSCMSLRYAVSIADAASGILSVLGAVFVCTAGGSGMALSAAGEAASQWSDRAAVTLIPSPEGLL